MNIKAELHGLTIFGADNAIKEFYSARADNMLAKRDMYSKISKYGYCYLEELESDISQNQTINTINTYMLGGGIKSDIIESKEDIAKNELKRQVKNQAKHFIQQRQRLFSGNLSSFRRKQKSYQETG